jgi:hypothetical protein
MNITLKKLIDESNIDESLIRAVIKQIGGFNELKERAEDVTNYGASGGFGGFIYYDDTVPFAKANLPAIMTGLKELANECGEGNEFDCIALFNCLNGLSASDIARAINVDEDNNNTTVLNALAWFALEEVSRAYYDLKEYF